MNPDEAEFLEYCDRLTWKHTAQYLHFLIAYPMAIAAPNPSYQEDF